SLIFFAKLAESWLLFPVTGGQNISRRLLFETTRGHAFNTLGMKYDQNGYLVVPRKGLYFIYAQVTFYCSSHCTKPPHQFSACIHKRTRHYPEPEVLLKSHVRPPTDTDGYLRFSTYQAGVFELFNNDSLYIEVYKDPAFRVSVHEHETYFGAFLL
uniref:THD domain-containing protein n=1 Tax=Callorhinchus milii TaxID=7868 RepID=A0A4W3HJV9_CALMI